ncbi:MAG: P-II family nitrogen regulator [Acidobacteriota bacterium]
MKIVRCLIGSNQVGDLTDAFASTGIVSLTVTGGSTWRPQQPGREQIYRGRKYSLKFAPESVVDVTVQDQAVDDVVRILIDTCALGPDAVAGRLFVMPIDQPSTVVGSRRVA